jgi:hypothetical protein
LPTSSSAPARRAITASRRSPRSSDTDLPIGSQTSAGRPVWSPRNRRGATPTILKLSAPAWMVRPTMVPGLSSSSAIAALTTALRGWLSASVVSRSRPADARIRSVSKKASVTFTIRTR